MSSLPDYCHIFTDVFGAALFLLNVCAAHGLKSCVLLWHILVVQ